MISTTTIEAVKSLPIEDVIGKFIKLKKAGANYKALSPFTDEKTPSFSVSTDKQIFKCFSSGIGGDGIKFVMTYSKIEYLETITDICNKFNIPIEHDNIDNAELKQKAETKEVLIKINEAAAVHFATELGNAEGKDSSFVEIINKRNFTADSILQWQIGYAPNSWDFLTKKLVLKGYYEHGITLGLIKTKNGKNYDTYRNRIMYPIHNHLGRCVGFGGRDVSGEKETPKYINSTESPLYNKSGILYGLHHAIQSIRKNGFAYITEGYTDVISFHQAGLSNTVASCGTSFTHAQARLLKKYCKAVSIVYDPDNAGIKAALSAMDILLEQGFEVHICPLPDNQDPDEFIRATKNPKEYIREKQENGFFYKADILLTDANPVQRNDRFNDIARSLALLDTQQVLINDYGRSIAKKHKLDWATFKKIIADHAVIREKKNTIKKNKVVQLNGNVNSFPFFSEEFNKDGVFQKLIINKVKFVQLLTNFGYCRYEVAENNNYTFVRLQENLITNFNRDEIIDHLENYIKNDYDFEGAGCDMVNSEILLNKMYDSMRTLFSKDLFARMRLDQPIIINKDDVNHTYYYYKNGFVTVDKNGWNIQDYDQMNGSVWSDQTLDRKFTNLSDDYKNMQLDNIVEQFGVFADFVHKISGAFRKDGSEQEKYNTRFYSLATIIGYVTHDFYEYKLKSILLTDSTLSDESDGRTGKTLLGKLIGAVRSYCEINGKNFDANDTNRYSTAKMGTQIVHLNDVKHRGRNKFSFEDVFNDVTEGYMVKHLYMEPFRNYSKMIISTNKTLNISGGSQRDRIVQFEVSDYFNENHSPQDEYGQWFMRDWDEKEWSKFDNFLCFCSMLFHQCKDEFIIKDNDKGYKIIEPGIIQPSSINLELRQLIDHTCQDFIDFMNDIKANLKDEKIKQPWPDYPIKDGDLFPTECIKFSMFVFDKKILYNQFKHLNEDYEKTNWFTQKVFTKWLKMYSNLILAIPKPTETRSNGQSFIQFKLDKGDKNQEKSST